MASNAPSAAHATERIEEGLVVVLTERGDALDAAPNHFMTWRDMVITPAIQTAILGLAAAVTYSMHVALDTGAFGMTVVFAVAVFALTIVALKVVRALHPLEPGVYAPAIRPVSCYVWNLTGFLLITNLAFLYTNGLVPLLLRKAFYQLLGAKFGKGVMPVAGRIQDPWLVTVEENAILGEESLVLGHAMLPQGVLALGRVEIRRGAVVGAKSVIMPGVTIGENAMVNAMSLVPMNTKIGAGEIWGGNPATKLGSVSQRREGK